MDDMFSFKRYTCNAMQCNAASYLEEPHFVNLLCLGQSTSRTPRSAHQEAGHVEVMARHIHEDTTAALQVSNRWRGRVAAGDVDGAHVSDSTRVNLVKATWICPEQSETHDGKRHQTDGFGQGHGRERVFEEFHGKR